METGWRLHLGLWQWGPQWELDSSGADCMGEMIGSVDWGEFVGLECTAVKQGILQASEQGCATTPAMF